MDNGNEMTVVPGLTYSTHCNNDKDNAHHELNTKLVTYKAFLLIIFTDSNNQFTRQRQPDERI